MDLNRHVYGNPEARFTIVEYGDFQCPYCRAAAPKLRTLIDESGGEVRLVYRHFPLFTSHAFALTTALAAEASGEHFWQMHDLLFAHQDRLTDADLAEYGEMIGAHGVVGEPAQAFRPAVAADYRAGVADGVRGTPTLFIDSTPYLGRADVKDLRAAIDARR